MQWSDCRLSWNKTEFGGVDQILVTNKAVWIPDIAIFENTDYVLRGILEYYNVRIFSNGNIYYRFPSVVKTSCMLQTRNFPFDLQQCNLTFSSWAYFTNEVDLHAKNPFGDTSSYVPNSQWELLGLHGVSLKTRGPKGILSEVTYIISLKRIPFFHILSFIFPCLLISSISLLGFLLPPRSGEKVSIGVTVLLSLSVFLLVVNQKLPPNSDEIPYIGIYFASCMLLVSLSCVMSVVTVNIYYKSSMITTFPVWIENIQQSRLGKMIGPKIFLKNASDYMVETTPSHISKGYQLNSKKESCSHRRRGIEGLAYRNSSYVDENEPSDLYNVDGLTPNQKTETENTNKNEGVTEALEFFLHYLNKHDGYQQNIVEIKWKTFAQFIDRIFMFVHVVTFTVITAVLLILCAFF
ncbi:neuronal acetylcholine receptor subunit alpha-10-like [Argonauta hians]